MRRRRVLGFAGIALVAALGGCQLVVEFDRSRIDESPIDDAGSTSGDPMARDAAPAPDAGDDAGDDAASTGADAAADAKSPDGG
jgi:hypothetical protein